MEKIITHSSISIGNKTNNINSTATIEKNDIPESYPGFWKLFACKCPRCRQGSMFETSNPWLLKTTMRMNKYCPSCDQPLDIEVGFYYGSSLISYTVSVALSVTTLLLWWATIGFSLSDNRFFYWLMFNGIFLILLQPYLMRLGRTGWLAIFVRYDGNWRSNPPKSSERTNKDQENNW